MNPLLKPAGSGPVVSKSADTRFKNNRQAAKQANVMGSGAKQVFKRTTQALRKPAAAQQGGAQAPQEPVQQIHGQSEVPPPQVQAQFFSQSPVANQPPGPEFDPDSFVRDELDKIVYDRKLEKVLASPEVHASVSRIKLQDHFKRNDPNAVPDQTPTSQRVIGNVALPRGR